MGGRAPRQFGAWRRGWSIPWLVRGCFPQTTEVRGCLIGQGVGGSLWAELCSLFLVCGFSKKPWFQGGSLLVCGFWKKPWPLVSGSFAGGTLLLFLVCGFSKKPLALGFRVVLCWRNFNFFLVQDRRIEGMDYVWARGKYTFFVFLWMP